MDAADIPLRVGNARDWPQVSALMGRLFHHPPEPETEEAEGLLYEAERALLAEDAGTLVGHAVAYTRDLAVPGAVIPAAHVTAVGVLPTHRRRGLLNRMMTRMLGEQADAGRESIAVLWASEASIYQRYGFGQAAQRLRMQISTREVRITSPATGTLRIVTPSQSRAEFTSVYDRLLAERVGWSRRDDRWWQNILLDVEKDKPLQAVVYEDEHGPAGYALWRASEDWDNKGPKAHLDIREVTAADPAGYRALWRFLMSIDLVTTATYPYAALDEPLLHLVGEPRRLDPSALDSLWVRIVDLPAALTARRYPAPLDVVMEVEDTLLKANTGRWRLTVDTSGRATCTRTEDPADLACTVLELASAYLGGVSLATHHAAGTVHELTPGAVVRAATAFSWHRKPQAVETF